VIEQLRGEGEIAESKSRIKLPIHSRPRQPADSLSWADAAESFRRLRRLALNVLRKDKTLKVGLKTKAKACSWDDQYLLNILTQ